MIFDEVRLMQTMLPRGAKQLSGVIEFFLFNEIIEISFFSMKLSKYLSLVKAQYNNIEE